MPSIRDTTPSSRREPPSITGRGLASFQPAGRPFKAESRLSALDGVALCWRRLESARLVTAGVNPASGSTRHWLMGLSGLYGVDEFGEGILRVAEQHDGLGVV